MSDREASRTALATAYMRAVHQLFDGEPRILEDPIVVRLIGETALQQINDPVNRYRSSEIGALRAHVVLRSRFAERPPGGSGSSECDTVCHSGGRPRHFRLQTAWMGEGTKDYRSRPCRDTNYEALQPHRSGSCRSGKRDFRQCRF